jgi:hypothetical protein
MIRTILPVSVAIALSGFAAQAYGQYQQYPQYPNDAYGQYDGPGGRIQGGYNGNSAYGRYDRADAYGRYDRRSQNRRGDVFESVRQDLEQAASQYSYRGSDERRFNSALDHLARFREAMIRGEYRKGDLDKTIQQTQEIARSGSIPPELRSMLYRDADMLRDYRARMDRQRDSYYYSRRPYGY